MRATNVRPDQSESPSVVATPTKIVPKTTPSIMPTNSGSTPHHGTVNSVIGNRQSHIQMAGTSRAAKVSSTILRTLRSVTKSVGIIVRIRSRLKPSAAAMGAINSAAMKCNPTKPVVIVAERKSFTCEGESPRRTFAANAQW